MFLYPKKELSERDIKKATSFTVESKTIKILWNKSNQGAERPCTLKTVRP